MNMGTKKYDEYLQSDEWKAKRKQKLEAVNYQCEKCGTAKNIEVHHLNYDRLGFEKLEDLVVLCKTHHTTVHENDLKKKEPSFWFFLLLALLMVASLVLIAFVLATILPLLY
jgi:hypothetical protein